MHLDNAGYRELGREIGRAVLRTQYRISVGKWPGPVLDAAVLKPDASRRHRRTVVAHFAEVEQLAGADSVDFAIVDAEGTNRCVAVDAGNTTVTLTCEKDVVLPARLVYGFGRQPKASLADEVGNRAPAVQLPITVGEPPQERVTEAHSGAG